MNLIRDVLSLNPHSVHTINQLQDHFRILVVALDNMQVIYKIKDSKVVVLRILDLKVLGDVNLTSNEKAPGEINLRSAEWLQEISQFIDP